MREVSWILLPSTYLPFYYKTTKIPYLIYYIQFISSTATTSHVPTISTITIMKIPKHLYSQIVTLLNTLFYSTQIKRRTEPFGTLCLHPSLLHPDKIQKDDTWDLVLSTNLLICYPVKHQESSLPGRERRNRRNRKEEEKEKEEEGGRRGAKEAHQGTEQRSERTP